MRQTVPGAPRAAVREQRVPPVLLAAIAGVAQIAIVARFGRHPSLGSLAGAALVAGTSTWLLADSVRRFRRSSTTVDPTLPAAASTLITAGANAVTRNPMYVAMAGMLAAHAVGRRSWPSLLPVVGFIAAMSRWQIAAEEQALAEHFGDAYAGYRATVPRWLGPASLRAATSACASRSRCRMRTA